MINENEFLRKVSEHNAGEQYNIQLLKSLISDIDDFNNEYAEHGCELYIDYDDVGTQSEGDPYETFSINMYCKQTNTSDNVVDCLDMNELDNCVCMIYQYFDVLYEFMNKAND